MFYFLCSVKHNSYIQKSTLHNFPLKKTLDLGLNIFLTDFFFLPLKYHTKVYYFPFWMETISSFLRRS